MSRPIAVLLEIENDGHDADRCFAGLHRHFTLGVPAAVREHGMEPVTLDTDGCNARFRDLLAERFAIGTG